MDKAPERFDLKIGRFYQRYCDNEAQHTMFDYLCAFWHLTKDNYCDHTNYIEMLVQYSNKLPGLTPAVDAAQAKKIIFDH
eukprot:15340047-Ditylum_brightwellii.AAC.2